MLGRVLFTRGIVLREMGAPMEAIEQLHEVLERFSEYSDLGSEFLGPTWYNLGLALRQAKRYREALNAYATAAQHFRQAGTETPLCMTLHNLAWAACLHGEFDTAVAALDEAEPLCKTDVLRWHQTLGRAHLEAVRPGGDRGLATQGCMALMERQAELPPDVMSHACWLAGRVSLELQLYDKAMIMADLAVHHAVKANGENRTLHDASELRRAVAITMGLVPRETGS
jgi:tetratricopeptide (TPR) repeat protein